MLLPLASLAAALLADAALPSPAKKVRPLSDWCRCPGPTCLSGHPAFGALHDLDWVFASREERLERIRDRLSEVMSYSDLVGELDAGMDADELGDLTLQASTWPDWPLFPGVKPVNVSNDALGILFARGTDVQRVLSPSGTYAFVRRRLPKATPLALWTNQDDAGPFDVVFDAPVALPILFERTGARGSWSTSSWQVWMSLTPAEVISQWPALLKVRQGKPGQHVVVGGLGMGWLLAKVLAEPKVAKVTLIEENQELCDWILPQLCGLLPVEKPVDVVVGDLFEEISDLTADTALLDIWPAWTDISEDMRMLKRLSGGKIRRWWGWGY